MAENDLVLYGLIRSDMASMTSGMQIAHGMHAQQHATYDILLEPQFDEKWTELYKEWMKSTKQGFGTTLSLNLNTLDRIKRVVEFARLAGFPAGVTHDPTYPVFDGGVVHLIPIDTAGWVFGSRQNLIPLLDQYPLV